MTNDDRETPPGSHMSRDRYRIPGTRGSTVMSALLLALLLLADFRGGGGLPATTGPCAHLMATRGFVRAVWQCRDIAAWDSERTGWTFASIDNGDPAGVVLVFLVLLVTYAVGQAIGRFKLRGQPCPACGNDRIPRGATACNECECKLTGWAGSAADDSSPLSGLSIDWVILEGMERPGVERQLQQDLRHEIRIGELTAVQSGLSFIQYGNAPVEQYARYASADFTPDVLEEARIENRNEIATALAESVEVKNRLQKMGLPERFRMCPSSFFFDRESIRGVGVEPVRELTVGGGSGEVTYNALLKADLRSGSRLVFTIPVAESEETLRRCADILGAMVQHASGSV